MKKDRTGRFLIDGSLYILSTIITTIITLGTLPLFTRKLSPADYGIIALFIAFGSVTSGLLSLGVNHASYRYYFDYKEDPEAFKVLNSSNILFMLCIYSIFSIFIYFLSSWFSVFLFDRTFPSNLILLSFISGCIGQLFLSFTLILTAQERPITFSIITIAQTLLKTILSLYLMYIYSLTYLAVIYGTLLTQGLIFVSLIYIHRKIIGLQFSFLAIKKSLIYSFPRIPRQLIGLAGQSIDKVLLNKYSGLTSLGNYTFGVKFATLLHMVLSGIEKVWTPFFLNKANDGTEKSKTEIVERYFEIVFFIMVVGLCIIYFSEEMIILLTTPEYYPAMFVTPIYVYITIFGLLGLLAVNQLMFAEKLLYLLPASIVNIMIYTIANIILIPILGAVGAAISSAIAALCAGMVHIYYGQKKYPLPIKLGKLTVLFIILLTFTGLSFPIMLMDLNIAIKILFKLLLILLFSYLGFKMKYIDIGKVIAIYNKYSLQTIRS